MEKRSINRPRVQVGLLLTNVHQEFFLVEQTQSSGQIGLPCVDLQANQRLDYAAEHAGMEQTFYDYDMEGIRYVDTQFFTDEADPRVIVIYGADNPYNLSATETPDPQIIKSMGWYGQDEIIALANDNNLRDADAVLGAIQNTSKNVIIPEESIGDIQKWGLPWFRAGALVYNKEGKILMMHEARVQVEKIKDPALKQGYLDAGKAPDNWVDGDGGWNLPSGRVRVGETYTETVIREVGEESGWQIKLEGLLHTRTSRKPGKIYTMPVFLAHAVDGPKQYHTEETSEIGWFTPAEIQEMNKSGVLRSPEFVMASLEAFELKPF